MTMEFGALPEFEKDVKRLTKKYRSIPEDLETVKQVLAVMPEERPPFSFRINNLGIESCIIKVKKIACKSLKGRGINSGLRLVYAHFPQLILEEQPEEDDTQTDEERIVLVELYHKSDKEMEDRNRILSNFS